MPHLSKRSAIAPFIVMDIMRAAADVEARGRHVLHLEVGQPCTQAPAGARAAAKAAIDGDLLGYTVALGMLALRERIAAHYHQWYGQALEPGRVAVTAGASGGFMTACLAAFDAGARVAVPTPGYPCYRNTLESLGLVPVELRLTPEAGYRPTPAGLAALGDVDGLVIASPNNPTGTVLQGADMAMIADYCRAQDVQLISDEIYHGLTYDEAGRTQGVETTAIAHSEDAIVINSFSKYFSMTGWRIGWMVVPPGMVRRVELLTQNLVIASATPSQHAALAAFDCVEELDGHTRRYAANRRIVLDALAAVGVRRVAPADGAFYVYADVGHLTSDSQALCLRALEELGVAITPGNDFDPRHGQHAIRLSYARSTAEVREAVERLTSWLPAQASR